MFKEKGVTLIALIITIIVMLILVIVTVQISTSGDLVNKAHDASSQTKAATLNENSDANKASDEIDELINPTTDSSLFSVLNSTITGYTGDLPAVKIPKTIDGNTITAIDSRVFEDDTNLISVIIPEGITTIGYEAFAGCTSLTSVTLPSTLTKIEGYTFSDCTSLESISLPNNLTTVGEKAFTNTPLLDNLLEEGNGIAILDYVLIQTDYDVVASDSYVMPNTVRLIAEYAFDGCNFTGLTLSSNLIYIGRAAFVNCDNFTSVVIPSGVITISTQAFFNCYTLADVIIPSSVTTIGSDAFHSCSSSLVVNIAKTTDSISGSPWGASVNATINWNYTPQ